MSVDLPTQDPVAASLESYEPERYWAVWQHPECRYAYMIDGLREAWLITMDSRQAGESYLAADARMNGRSLSQYRPNELTLPDAFHAVRSQSVPFVSSQGIPVLQVLGVELRTKSPLGTRIVRRIPL